MLPTAKPAKDQTHSDLDKSPAALSIAFSDDAFTGRTIGIMPFGNAALTDGQIGRRARSRLPVRLPARLVTRRLDDRS